MPKNIVLFIDGTWNEPQSADVAKNTNVRRLHDATVDDYGQRVQYLWGIGTARLPKVFLKLPNPVARVVGGSFGYGMAKLVRKGYRFLSLEYQRGDRIYLFGFSRGAFAVRSLAGFADQVGLLLKTETSRRNIRRAYELYEQQIKGRESAMRDYLQALPNPEEQTDLPIYFIGLWDTVGALGLPGRLAWFSAPFTEHHKTDLPKNVTHARHALALHELRQNFRPLLWTRMSRPSGQTLEQAWFPGAHSDVGGGYAESDWSETALDWIASEAVTWGLRVNGLPRVSPAVPNATIHNSISGAFALASPEIREPLSVPEGLARETAATMSLSPISRRRLLNGLATAYGFGRTEVNAALADVDDRTLRLHVEPFRTRASRSAGTGSAIDPWWLQPHAARVSAARPYVGHFLAATSAATPAERDVLTEAVCLLLVVDEEDGLATLTRALRKVSSEWTQRRLSKADFAAVNAFLDRLGALLRALTFCERVGTESARAASTKVREIVDTNFKSVHGHLHQAIVREERRAARVNLTLKPSDSTPGA
jgi:hypothetical protein